VLEPVFCLEASRYRNRHSGGVGLGLSIARDTARRHQEELELRNGEVGGLVATLHLPRNMNRPPA
jgi:protein-histidine pros-kinase